MNTYRTANASSILVRLSCEPESFVRARVESIVSGFAKLGAVVGEIEALGSRTITLLEVTTPRPSEIADFVLQLGQLGEVAVVTAAERAEQKA